MILFVIIFMMAFKPNFLTRENLARLSEEQQILKELNRIGLMLKGKSTKMENSDHYNLRDSAEAKTGKQVKISGIDKFKVGAAIQNPQIQNFSQICNPIIDDDSLFDGRRNILEQPEGCTVILSTYSDSNKEDSSQKHNKVGLSQCSFSQISFQRDFNLKNYSQSLKRNNGLYLKSHEQSQFFQKQACMRINSKIDFEKDGLNLLKSQQNLEILSCFKYSNQNNKTDNKEKYQQAIEDSFIRQQIKIQSKEFKKLSTFQHFISNQDKLDHQSKENFNINQFECTFKPSIQFKSMQINKSNKALIQPKQKKQYNLNNLNFQHNKQNRIEQLNQPRRLKTLQSEYCQQAPSFKPILSKKSLDQMSNCTYDVARRNKVWLQQKNEKLQKIKQQEQLERNKRQTGTYAPLICKYKKQIDPAFSKFGKQGFINHFQRLSGVKKKLIKSKGEQTLQNKQNKQIKMNQTKISLISKGVNKQNYSEAVKKLNTRIMSLNI